MKRIILIDGENFKAKINAVFRVAGKARPQWHQYDFKIILQGRVRGQFEADGRLVFKEKGVDVKIAVDMVSLACDKKADEILLLSSDSDLQPAIAEVKKRGVSCVYIGFEDQPNRGMTYTADRTILIRNTEVLR